MQTEGDITAVILNLGARIKVLRDGLDMSQQSFCDMISMDRSYLCGVETGQRNVSIKNLYKIARGFDISLSEMLADVDDPASIARRRELMEELLRKEQKEAGQKPTEQEPTDQEPAESESKAD